MAIKRDIRRLIKSQHIHLGFIIVIALSVFLSLVIGKGTKFGISVFGDLTIFKNAEAIFINGLNYTKGIGLISAVLICLYIGKEYQNKTWQHLVSCNVNRLKIYTGKLISSITISVGLFLSYEIISYTILKLSNANPMPTSDFITLILNGVIVYSLLASIVCLISMIIKNPVSALIVGMFFVLFEKTIVNLIGKMLLLLKLENVFYFFSKHTLHGINEFILSSNTTFSPKLLLISGLMIFATWIIGNTLFKRYEL